MAESGSPGGPGLESRPNALSGPRGRGNPSSLKGSLIPLRLFPRVLIPFLFTLALASLAFIPTAGSAGESHLTSSGGVPGLVASPALKYVAWSQLHTQEDAWYAGIAQRDAQRAAAARAAVQRPHSTFHAVSSSGGAVTGSCEAMKPAGFPDYIIQRESRGNPNARNPSGAYGCVQLMPGYLTGNYGADWAKLWNNGAGACNWNPPNYCAG